MTGVDDTIAALASPAGPGARAIVRLSGPETRQVLASCFRPDSLEDWGATRGARRHTGTISLPGWRCPVAASVLLWPDGRSYTGAPSAEIAVIGSPPVVETVLTALYAGGARPARAGEFTLRAFLAGRLDLLQAEAVLGVIQAEDHVQLRSALDQLAGGLSGEIGRLRESLLIQLADLEAGLDFVDEDIEFVSRAELRARLSSAVSRLDALASQARQRLASTGRRDVVLVGLPNAGKSTLFNRLAGQARAIVSPQKGTTRDTLSAEVQLGGMAVTLWDTAGWEWLPAVDSPLTTDHEATASSEAIDDAAAELRGDRIQRADLIVWCTAADLPETDFELDRQLQQQLPPSVPVLRVVTRGDLQPAVARQQNESQLVVSGETGLALERLNRSIRDGLAASGSHSSELLGSTAARCHNSLRRSGEALSAAMQLLDDGGGDELLAMELRAGLEALGEVCGAVYTDDVLDRIFSRFCIGK
ncbi:MAG: tRNA modification GTPase [Planctomycetaceae bacterium]